MTTTFKRHGLWQWHRCLHKNEHPGEMVRWWDTEAEKAYRIIDWGYMTHKGARLGEYAKYLCISRCAYRYMRMNKVPMTNVNYVNMCLLIGKRAFFNRLAINAAIDRRDMCRSKASINFETEFARPSGGGYRTIAFLRDEAERRKKDRKQREDALRILEDKWCFVCKKHESIKYQSFHYHFVEKCLDKAIPERSDCYGLRVCWSCSMHLRKLQKKWLYSENTRLEINRVKRIKHESTQNNAGTP